ncbi:MAG: desulfoferrodoxin [Clostridia bacterium]|nr:desulfoferrodoxin [Clostridia bacterium]
MKFYRTDAGIAFGNGEGQELIPNTSDGAGEKHVPVVEREGTKVHVKVGAVAHPMLEAHFINFIALETDKGFQLKELAPGDEPEADFSLAEAENILAVYEYCNLHGLWKA